MRRQRAGVPTAATLLQSRGAWSKRHPSDALPSFELRGTVALSRHASVRIRHEIDILHAETPRGRRVAEEFWRRGLSTGALPKLLVRYNRVAYTSDGLDLHDDQRIGGLLDQVALQITPSTVTTLQAPRMGLLELISSRPTCAATLPSAPSPLEPRRWTSPRVRRSPDTPQVA